MRTLDAFLARQSPLFAEDDLWYWQGTPTPLRRTTYLTAEEPPLAVVTSVRAIVFRGEEVLVIREPTGSYSVVPGGRREPGETIEATLRREVLEETGWSLGAIEHLAVTHYRYIGPCPPGYPSPYPDFAQLIFLAEATSVDSDGRIPDEWVAESASISRRRRCASSPRARRRASAASSSSHSDGRAEHSARGQLSRAR